MIIGDGKLLELISDVVEFISVMWLGDGFIGWIEEGKGKGKLGIIFKFISWGRPMKLLRKFWFKRKSCIRLTSFICISLCGEWTEVSSKVTSLEIIICIVDLTWSLYTLDRSLYSKKMHSWECDSNVCWNSLRINA